MASSSSIMRSRLDENSPLDTPLRKLGSAIINKNVAGILDNHEAGLPVMQVDVLPVMMRNMLQTMHAQADNDQMIIFLKNIFKISKSNISAENSKVISEAIKDYMRSLVTDKEKLQMLRQVILQSAQETSNQAVDVEFKKLWNDESTKVDLEASAPQAVQSAGYWGVFSGGLQLAGYYLTQLKDAAVYYEKVMDDDLLVSSPNNSPRQ